MTTKTNNQHLLRHYKRVKNKKILKSSNMIKKEIKENPDYGHEDGA